MRRRFDSFYTPFAQSCFFEPCFDRMVTSLREEATPRAEQTQSDFLANQRSPSLVLFYDIHFRLSFLTGFRIFKIPCPRENPRSAPYLTIYFLRPCMRNNSSIIRIWVDHLFFFIRSLAKYTCEIKCLVAVN